MAFKNPKEEKIMTYFIIDNDSHLENLSNCIVIVKE